MLLVSVAHAIAWIDVPNADMCSLLLIGRNPTNGICILASVPRENHVL